MAYLNKRKAKKDDNHNEVMQVFEDCLYHTVDLYATDCGMDFIAWGKRGVFCVEVKDGSKPPSQTKLTDREKDSKLTYGDRYFVIYSRAQAINLLT